jgi:acetyltransferase-like isoleucine patch superfamily enzyme
VDNNSGIKKLRGYYSQFLYLAHRVKVRIRILIWKVIYDIYVGEGTDFKDMNYINTLNGPIVIGNQCQINAFCLMGPIEFGGHVLINHMSDVAGSAAKVIIGNNVLIAPRVLIMACMHNHHDKQTLIRLQGVYAADVVIGDDVWIGTGSIILPGVTIGTGAVTGANSVVTANIPEYSIAVGAPARVVGTRE